jgi:hypothetical protein
LTQTSIEKASRTKLHKPFQTKSAKTFMRRMARGERRGEQLAATLLTHQAITVLHPTFNLDDEKTRFPQNNMNKAKPHPAVTKTLTGPPGIEPGTPGFPRETTPKSPVLYPY